MIWGRAASSRRDGGERGRLYRISGARQLPCMAVRGKKRATTAVRVRGGGRRCSSLSPRGRGGGKPLPLHSDGWEGDVPAVSNARRLVDRLQGGQHCRRALEIRSEVSAPARLLPRWLGGGYLVSSLLVLGSGGRRGYGRRHFFRRRSWITAGSARTRQGTLGSLEPPFAAASSDEGRCKTKRRRKPLPQWRSAVSYEQPCTRNVPQRTSRHHGGAVRVTFVRQQLAAGTARPRQRLRPDSVWEA